MIQITSKVDGVSFYVTDLIDLRYGVNPFNDSHGSFRIPQEVVEQTSPEKLGRVLKSCTWMCLAIDAEARTKEAFSQVSSARGIPDEPFENIANAVIKASQKLSSQQKDTFFDRKMVGRFNEIIREAERRRKDDKSGQESTEEANEDRPGFVYIAFSNGLYKIGRSKEPQERIEHFDTQMPVDVNELHRFKADDYVLAERKLHRAFSHARANGEWFDLSDDELEVLTDITSYQDGCFFAGDDKISDELNRL
jgi:hypothetical protein